MAKGYSIQGYTTGAAGDAGTNTEYFLADPDGNGVFGVRASTDDYGGISGYYIDNSSGGGESDSMGSQTYIDLDAINARAEKGNVPFGTGMGPALGYEYGMKNSSGDIFRKFDAKGNLTEYLDDDLKWQKASDFKPVGLQFNAMTGNLETKYTSPNSKRANITESNAMSVNRYHHDQGGWLGEGGWKNMGMLALTALSAGAASGLSGAGLAGAAGANLAESAAAITALLEGGSALGNALQIGNQLVNIGTSAYDSIKSNHPESAAVIERLQAETKKNEDAGMTRDQAVETAMNEITKTTPPVTKDTATETQADEVDPIARPLINELTTRVERYQAEGKSRDDAIAQSIVDLSNSSTANKNELITLISSGDQDLMDALGETKEDLTSQLTNLGTDLGGQITGVRTDLTDLGTDLGGQITDVRDDLTGEIIGVRDDLTGQITDVRTDLTDLGTDLGGQITTVGGQVTDLTTDFGDYRTEQEKLQEEEQREKRGKEAVDLLSQMATTTVKTPEVAKIDYMYDIGGNSLFATPKQESLMPSPFEDAPEPVEGAMPRYQYYAPGGGYLYADGGLIDGSDMQTIDDLYRMLGSK